MKARWVFLPLFLAIAFASHVPAQQETFRTSLSAGRQHYDNGRFAEAEKEFERAAAQAPAGSVGLADSLNLLGLARWKLGKYPEAEEAHLKARPLYKQLNGEKSGPFASSTNNLGLVYWHQGRLKEGDEMLAQALKILEAVEGQKGLNFARGLNNTGGLYRGRGFWKKAEPLLLRSIAIWEFREFPHADGAYPYENLGRLRQNQGKQGEAVELFQKALDVSKKKLDALHPQVGQHWGELGEALRRHNKLNEAEIAILAGKRIVDTKLPKEHTSQANSLRYLARLRHAQGKSDEAQPLFEQSLAIWAKQAVQPPASAQTHLQFAQYCAEVGKAELASKHFQEAVAIFEKTVGVLSPDLAVALEAFAAFLQPTNAKEAAALRACDSFAVSACLLPAKEVFSIGRLSHPADRSWPPLVSGGEPFS